MTSTYIRHRFSWVITAVILLAVTIPAAAQSDPSLTQYFRMPSLVNPGAAGSTDYLRINGGSRLQWIGIEHAPRAFIATADMPFKLLDKRFGTGITLQQESYGLNNNLIFDAQLSYNFKALGGRMSAGLQVGLMSHTFRGSEVFLPDDDDYHTGSDDAIPTTDLNGMGVDMAAGVWYEHKLFYAGLSCTHINSPSVSMTTEGQSETQAQTYDFTLNRTLYFTAGSNIAIKNTLFELIPSVQVKSDFTFTQVDITARVRYNKFMTAGFGFRSDDAVSLILGVDFKNFYIGYSYDYPINAISRASSGSHEVFAGYKLKLDLSEKNRNRHKSIRIM
ncbi:MAG: type IX secretion system membrane protein PorP/SprF [Muribaculaceae bacterium]|nr:type IX secretion system membrane protein PorP/SprF [Muribaculaceae bacterium]